VANKKKRKNLNAHLFPFFSRTHSRPLATPHLFQPSRVEYRPFTAAAAHDDPLAMISSMNAGHSFSKN
jgi:hypothetical protein